MVVGARKNFPVGFFDGPNADEKLAILLAEAIRKFMPLPVDFQDKSYEDKLAYYYVFFSSPCLVIDKLKEAKIYDIFYERFDAPLDYFHNSLGRPFHEWTPFLCSYLPSRFLS